MKLKNMLLIMIVVVMIPEILLTAYIVGKYTSISLGFPEFSSTDILSFFMSNPLLLVLILAVFIVMLILYFALQVK